MTQLPFHYLVVVEPLGFLYGSSGRLLSPEALTGRASEHFPPDSPAMAGLIIAASHLCREEVRQLHTAGPFCFDTFESDPDNALLLPTPFCLIQEEAQTDRRVARHCLNWHPDPIDPNASGAWLSEQGNLPQTHSLSGGWVSLAEWCRIGSVEPIVIHTKLWQAVPHLHPRLSESEKISDRNAALFMEYGIAMRPGMGLAYLSSHRVPEGRFRFGGEGHLVELRSTPIPGKLLELLKSGLGESFALITPGLWGGPRLSRREPIITSKHGETPILPWHHNGSPPALLTDRPRPWRHRLGSERSDHPPRLSRGRWAVPAGSCYRIHPEAKNAPAVAVPWSAWPEAWFPKEGFNFKQLGTALALPLPSSSR
jgi:CRISPR-associated protein Cmr3